MTRGLGKKYLAGQGLVEFVILLPILVLFIMIIFDLGRVAFVYSTIHNAAREGARYASVHHQNATTTEIADAAKQLTTGLDPSLISISASYPSSETVKVTINYPFTTATPVITRLLGYADNTITLSSQATMRLEQ